MIRFHLNGTTKICAFFIRQYLCVFKFTQNQFLFTNNHLIIVHDKQKSKYICWVRLLTCKIRMYEWSTWPFQHFTFRVNKHKNKMINNCLEIFSSWIKIETKNKSLIQPTDRNVCYFFSFWIFSEFIFRFI